MRPPPLAETATREWIESLIVLYFWPGVPT